MKEIADKIKADLKTQDVLQVLTLEEYITKYPDEKEDWEPGEYLVICDNEGHEVLSGAYSVHMQDGEPHMVWLPYPEDPIIGLNHIINHLNEQIDG